MNDERHDQRQIEGFRTLAARLSDALSQQKFEEALGLLMRPARDKEARQAGTDVTPPRARNQTP